MSRADARSQLMTDRRPLGLRERNETGDGVGQRIGVVTREPKWAEAFEKVVERRIRYEHRDARGGGFEDDLVRSTRAHVVDECRGAPEHQWHVTPRHRRAKDDGIIESLGRDEAHESLVVILLRGLSTGPVALERCVDPAPSEDAHGLHDCFEPFRRRVPPQRDEMRWTIRGLAARELRDIDPVTDSHDLRRVDRNRAYVDTQGSGRDANGEIEGTRSIPVGVPKKNPDAERSSQRGCKNSVDRAHMGDDGTRTIAS